MMEIGKKIREFRLKKNFTAEKMSLELNMSYQGYIKYENDTVKLIHPNLFKICELLEVSILDLLGIDNESIVSEPAETYQKKEIVSKLVELINYKDMEITNLKYELNNLKK